MHLNLVGAAKSGLRADGIPEQQQRARREFSQTILETREEAQSPTRQSTCPGQTLFAFPAFLSSSGWCPVVFRGGREFPGKPVLAAEIDLRQGNRQPQQILKEKNKNKFNKECQ